ncbi:MAG: ABC transporter permease [Bacteroidetes bacterium]|nr:ABC transporter permease [Bacteroidota bacterium]
MKVSLLNKSGLGVFLEKYAMIIIMFGLIVIMSILKPEHFPTYNNARNILRQTSVIGIIAIGVTFTIITAGIDISGGSVVAMTSVILAHFIHPAADGVGGEYPLIFGILLTLLVGVAAGGLVGVIVGYGHVPPFIVTLGMMSIARGIAMIISNGRPIGNFTDTFNYIGSGMVLGYLPVPIIIFILCGLVAYIILHRTKYGTYIYAIGGNPNAAIVSGINVKAITTLVYVLAGFFTAVAGIVVTARQQSGQPSVGIGYELEAITCVVIGGTSLAGGIGKISGTIIGAIIIGILTNGMTMMQVNPNWQLVVKGVIIVSAVLIDMTKKKR